MYNVNPVNFEQPSMPYGQEPVSGNAAPQDVKKVDAMKQKIAVANPSDKAAGKIAKHVWVVIRESLINFWNLITRSGPGADEVKVYVRTSDKYCFSAITLKKSTLNYLERQALVKADKNCLDIKNPQAMLEYLRVQDTRRLSFSNKVGEDGTMLKPDALHSGNVLSVLETAKELGDSKTLEACEAYLIAVASYNNLDGMAALADKYALEELPKIVNEKRACFRQAEEDNLAALVYMDVITPQDIQGYIASLKQAGNKCSALRKSLSLWMENTEDNYYKIYAAAAALQDLPLMAALQKAKVSGGGAYPLHDKNMRDILHIKAEIRCAETPLALKRAVDKLRPYLVHSDKKYRNEVLDVLSNLTAQGGGLFGGNKEECLRPEGFAVSVADLAKGVDRRVDLKQAAPAILATAEKVSLNLLKELKSEIESSDFLNNPPKDLGLALGYMLLYFPEKLLSHFAVDCFKKDATVESQKALSFLMMMIYMFHPEKQFTKILEKHYGKIFDSVMARLAQGSVDEKLKESLMPYALIAPMRFLEKAFTCQAKPNLTAEVVEFLDEAVKVAVEMLGKMTEVGLVFRGNQKTFDALVKSFFEAKGSEHPFAAMLAACFPAQAYKRFKKAIEEHEMGFEFCKDLIPHFAAIKGPHKKQILQDLGKWMDDKANGDLFGVIAKAVAVNFPEEYGSFVKARLKKVAEVGKNDMYQGFVGAIPTLELKVYEYSSYMHGGKNETIIKPIPFFGLKQEFAAREQLMEQLFSELEASKKAAAHNPQASKALRKELFTCLRQLYKDCSPSLKEKLETPLRKGLLACPESTGKDVSSYSVDDLLAKFIYFEDDYKTEAGEYNQQYGYPQGATSQKDYYATEAGEYNQQYGYQHEAPSHYKGSNTSFEW